MEEKSQDGVPDEGYDHPVVVWEGYMDQSAIDRLEQLMIDDRSDNDNSDDDQSHNNDWYAQQALNHPNTADCDNPECEICAYRDCPYHDNDHYHHDGCPSCSLVPDA